MADTKKYLGKRIQEIRKKNGLKQSELAEIVEIPEHKYFIACQFHPEFLSRPQKPHPLFLGLVEAALEK